MKEDLLIKEGLVIPHHELELQMSRASGPGGQHVNKSNTRVTIHWNIAHSAALEQEQKDLLLQKLASHLTNEGALVIHCGESRSQDHNKKSALARLAELVKKALAVPKKRMATRVSRSAQEARLKEKSKRGAVKKMRSQKNEHE